MCHRHFPCFPSAFPILLPDKKGFPSPPPAYLSPPLLVDGIELLIERQGHLCLYREHPVLIRKPIPHILYDLTVRLPEELEDVIGVVEVQRVLEDLKVDILHLLGMVPHVDGGGDIIVMVGMLQEELPVGLRAGHPLRKERRDTAGSVQGHHVKVMDKLLRGIGKDVDSLLRTSPVHTSLDVWAIVAIVRGMMDCLYSNNVKSTKTFPLVQRYLPFGFPFKFAIWSSLFFTLPKSNSMLLSILVSITIRFTK